MYHARLDSLHAQPSLQGKDVIGVHRASNLPQAFQASKGSQSSIATNDELFPNALQLARGCKGGIGARQGDQLGVVCNIQL